MGDAATPPSSFPPAPLATESTTRGRKLIAALVAAYAVLMVVLWAWMYFDGDRGWVATLILFGPRWLCAIPWPLLALAAAWRNRRMLGPLAITLFVIVVPIMGFQVRWPAGGSARPTLRVMTCNVNQDSFETRALARLIEQERPDIVALQEVASVTKFLWPADWYVVKVDEFIVASRWPVAERGRVSRPRSLYEYSAVRFTVQMPQREIQLFDVHLDSPRRGLNAVLSRTKGIDPQGASKLEAVLRIRAQESRDATAWIAKFPGPSIVLGDFNTPTESTVFRRDWVGFSDAFTSCGWGWGFTKISGKGGFSYGARIDHVLFNSPWHCLRCWVGTDIGSDHWPVLADFQ